MKIILKNNIAIQFDKLLDSETKKEKDTWFGKYSGGDLTLEFEFDNLIFIENKNIPDQIIWDNISYIVNATVLQYHQLHETSIQILMELYKAIWKEPFDTEKRFFSLVCITFKESFKDFSSPENFNFSVRFMYCIDSDLYNPLDPYYTYNAFFEGNFRNPLLLASVNRQQ